MFKNQKLVVVLPAYNAARTLRIICEELMAQSFVNLMILVDDAKGDEPSQGSHLRAESESLLTYACNGILRPEK
jgi:hypothetical protein